MNPMPTDIGQMAGLSFVQAGVNLATNCFILCCCFLHFLLGSLVVGGYTACGIPFVRLTNGNGNGIPVNGIPFNGIPFPFVSVKKNLPTSVNFRYHLKNLGGFR